MELGAAAPAASRSAATCPAVTQSARRSVRSLTEGGWVRQPACLYRFPGSRSAATARSHNLSYPSGGISRPERRNQAAQLFNPPIPPPPSRPGHSPQAATGTSPRPSRTHWQQSSAEAAEKTSRRPSARSSWKGWYLAPTLSPSRHFAILSGKIPVLSRAITNLGRVINDYGMTGGCQREAAKIEKISAVPRGLGKSAATLSGARARLKVLLRVSA